MFDLKHLQIQSANIMADVEEFVGKPMSPDELVRLFSVAIGQQGMDVYASVLRCAQDADSCRAANSWFPACLMLASSIEGLLCLIALLTKQEVQSKNSYGRLTKGKSVQDKILNAKFEVLIELADESGWLKTRSIDPELWLAVEQDLPIALSGLFPADTQVEQQARIEVFRQNRAVQMLRLLQHLRNLVHSTKSGRLGVDLKGPNFDDDCKFCFILGYQILCLLFESLISAAKDRMERLNNLRGKLSTQSLEALREMAQSMSEKTSVRFPPELASSMKEARRIKDGK